MPKPSNRQKILSEGLRVVHERGFANASVRDIVQAAGVPQGSFTNHFTSKEAFGLEIIDLYYARTVALLDNTLRNTTLTPLARLQAYVDANIARLADCNMRNGCLYGNFTAEASDHSEAMRLRLVEIFAEVREAVATCLRAAVAADELPARFACDDVAGFVVSSLQGAILLAKAHRDPAQVESFKRILFDSILH